MYIIFKHLIHHLVVLLRANFQFHQIVAKTDDYCFPVKCFLASLYVSTVSQGSEKEIMKILTNLPS